MSIYRYFLYSSNKRGTCISVFSLGVAGLVTIGLYFVQNSTQNLVLSCIFEALTSLAISLVFCVLVDLFPTNLRYF